MVCAGGHTKQYTRIVRINDRILHLLVLLSYSLHLNAQNKQCQRIFNALDPITSNLRELSTKIAKRPEVTE